MYLGKFAQLQYLPDYDYRSQFRTIYRWSREKNAHFLKKKYFFCLVGGGEFWLSGWEEETATILAKMCLRLKNQTHQQQNSAPFSFEHWTKASCCFGPRADTKASGPMLTITDELGSKLAFCHSFTDFLLGSGVKLPFVQHSTAVLSKKCISTIGSY